MSARGRGPASCDCRRGLRTVLVPLALALLSVVRASPVQSVALPPHLAVLRRIGNRFPSKVLLDSPHASLVRRDVQWGKLVSNGAASWELPAYRISDHVNLRLQYFILASTEYFRHGSHPWNSSECTRDNRNLRLNKSIWEYKCF